MRALFTWLQSLFNLQILLERVLEHRLSKQREALIWNSSPGALGTLATYGDSPSSLPYSGPNSPSPGLSIRPTVSTPRPVGASGSATAYTG